jgi:molybdenum cofactor guanylyltransferase
MIFSDSLAALLLAGGASIRMGLPKVLLDHAGQPLWRVQIEKLQVLAPNELFLSFPRELTPPTGPWDILHDREPGLGPLSGIHAALQTMKTEWLIVLAVDLPDMKADFLGALCEATTVRGVVPQIDGFYEGLAAIYPRSLIDLCGKLLSSEDRSLQNLVRQGIAAGFLEEFPVPVQNRALFRNVNRPSDL